MLMLVWVGTASAQPGRVVIECATPLTVTTQSATPPVVVTPPAVVTPPVVVVPPDSSPFPFPAGCPSYSARDFDRYYTLAVTDAGSLYAGETNTGNPLPGSHACAGILSAGATAVFGRNVGGLLLWVPRNADPALIRAVLRTGRP